MNKLTLLLLCVPAFAQQPMTVAGNFPRDLLGPIDTRPYTWGHAEAQTLSIKFNPPKGYRVRILKLRGDMTSMPTVKDSDPAIPNDRYAGTLLGFSTSSSTGSKECNYCADGCFVYIQDALHGGDAKRAPYDYDYTTEAIYLDADNALQLKIAAFLNTIGPVHIEATYVITFRYERSIPFRAGQLGPNVGIWSPLVYGSGQWHSVFIPGQTTWKWIMGQ